MNLLKTIFEIDMCYGCAAKSIIKKKYRLKMFADKNIMCRIWYCKSCLKEIHSLVDIHTEN